MNTLAHVTTLHQLLGLAYNDMVALKKDDRYRFNVLEWHHKTESLAKCSACVAGAIMSGTLKVHPDSNADPGDFDIRTSTLLDVVDSIRTSSAVEASNELSSAGILIGPRGILKLMRGLDGEQLEAGDNETWRALWKAAEEMGV